MTTQFRKRGDRLGDLVHLIVESELFRAKDFNGAAPGKTARTPAVVIKRAPAKPAVTTKKPSKVPGASDKTPAKARQWLSMAKNYIKAGRPDLAKKDLNKILKTYPKSVTATEAKKLLVKIR
jgi:TolA-binding protein